ncbi:hypothetical protein [Bradyrhizobium prioriisuperbiae]|uniref:hypothetical protein n=1 Tax=Bradyrhizobium prioriisuperbiae TaxID=2854389 RepID=UPI0028E34366|nr:hypothetical protein [Bradyrhizobium prioritasuperba]
MTGLRSDLFCGDKALQAALTVDAGHVVKGARGTHVRKIQAALSLLLDKPPCGISEGEQAAGLYGDTTADAVLRYKTENRIINTAYQTTPDIITGKMTMRALDDAMVGVEAELAADVLRVLARLDLLLARDDLDLSPTQRARFDVLRARVIPLVQPGAPPTGRFETDYRHGVALMDSMPRHTRPAIVFAALPLVAAGAGAAIAAFLLAIAAVIALILLTELVIESGKLGNRVNQAIEDAIAAGEAAILDNILVIDALDQAVEQCKRRSQNGTAACLAAIARFAAKKLVVVAKRNDLQAVLKALKDSLQGDPKKLVWKFLARRAETLARELAAEERELRDIAKDIIKECGCQFIKV